MSTFRIVLANIQFPATPEESIALAIQAIAAASVERADIYRWTRGAHVRTLDFAVWTEPDSVLERSLLKFDLINIGTARPHSREVRRQQIAPEEKLATEGST
jgi:hypothetical protein